MTKNIIAENRKAHFDYDITERLEAGVSLAGAEIKAVRAGRIDLSASYARVAGGEAWLINAVLNGQNVESPSRSRKLLLHKDEINHLIGLSEQKGLTLLALKMYFKRGKVKVELGVGRGRKAYDKRELIKSRDIAREQQKGLES